jgi:hypothetical protein
MGVRVAACGGGCGNRPVAAVLKSLKVGGTEKNGGPGRSQLL